MSIAWMSIMETYLANNAPHLLSSPISSKDRSDRLKSEYVLRYQPMAVDIFLLDRVVDARDIEEISLD